MPDTITSANCMSCGGRAYRSIDGTWRHVNSADWLSGGAHKVVLPEVSR